MPPHTVVKVGATESPMNTDGPMHDRKGTAMTETQSLLGKIAALRQRLEQAQKLASEANAAASSLFGAPAVAVLERPTADGAEHDPALDAAVHAVTPRLE